MLPVSNSTITVSGAGSSASGATALSAEGADLVGSRGVTPFSDLLADTVGQVTRLENQARTSIDGLMTGSGVDVHEAMIAEQKASMAFELALSVRNKAVDAYQQVMGMQF